MVGRSTRRQVTFELLLVAVLPCCAWFRSVGFGSATPRPRASRGVKNVKKNCGAWRVFKRGHTHASHTPRHRPTSRLSHSINPAAIAMAAIAAEAAHVDGTIPLSVGIYHNR